MKFSIHVNQKQALELGITNINQAVIFDLLTGLSTWAAPEVIENTVFYWVSRQRISHELPILGLKADTIYRHIKSLHEVGLIEYRKVGKKDCIRITEKGKSYYVGNKSEFADFTMSEMNPKNDQNSEINPNHYVGNESEKNSDLNPTYKTTIKQISLNNDQSPDEEVNFYIRPSLSEIQHFCQQLNSKVDPVAFFNHYESCEWMVSGQHIEDWQAVFRKWTVNANGQGKSVQVPSAMPKVDEELPGWASRQGLRGPAPGETYQQYRRSLQVLFDKKMKAGRGNTVTH